MADRLLSVDAATKLPVNPGVLPAFRDAVKGDITSYALSSTMAVFTPEQFGAVGDGAADDEAAVRAAFAAANAALRPGVVGTIWHPGATVKLHGRYNLPNLTAPVDVRCNVQSDATVIAPTSYAGVVLRVGHSTSGSIVQAATIALPDVIKVGSASPTAGSVGVQVINLYNSDVRFGRVAYFETGIHFTGNNNGTVYNTFRFGWISYCKVSFSLIPQTNGWINQNTFIGGGIQQSSGWAGGTRLTGWRHCILDGAPGGTAVAAIDGNTFLGVSFEGDVSEYCAYLRHAHQNTFTGCRHEPGSAGIAVTVSGDTFTTSSAHGLVVGDIVQYAATSYPTGLTGGIPYYVVTVVDSTNYKISRNRGATALTTSSSGSGVTYYRPHKVYLDNTNSAHVADDNVFQDYMSWPRTIDVVSATTGNANTGGSVARTSGAWVSDAAGATDVPLLRVRARSGSVRPLVAAYPTTVDPAGVPDGWLVALSDRGVLFGNANAEVGRLTQFSPSAGVLGYRRPADTRTYELPSWIRSQAGPVSITTLSCAANALTTTTLTLSGVAAGDHVFATPTTDLPAGLVQAWVRVSTTDTVKIGFYNATGSTISLTTAYALCAARQYL